MRPRRAGKRPCLMIRSILFLRPDPLKGKKLGPAIDGSPNPERQPKSQDWYRAEQYDIGPGEPALHNPRIEERSPKTDRTDRNKDSDKQLERPEASPVLQGTFGLHDEPCRAEKRVTESQADRRQNAERP